MLTATVTVDLNHHESGYFQDLDRDDRHVLQFIDQMPDGARLIVNVGERALVLSSACLTLRHASARLHVEIVAANPHVARRWRDAILGDAA